MKKIGYFFFCFLPLFASIALQFAAAFPVMGMCMIGICYPYIFSGTKISYGQLMIQLSEVYSNPQFTAAISVLFAACGILIFGFWYVHQFEGGLQQPAKLFSCPKVLLGLLLLVPGLQILSSILTTLSASLFPGWMEFYEKLMENAGFTTSISPLLILYAVLLGPIEEELTFRGVIFSSAQKAMPFWAANLFQALLFGIFHMNVIQGIYAFFIGLFLGFIAGRGGSIYFSIFLHILFNSWGTFISSDSPLYQNPIATLLFFFFSIAFGILGFFLFYKNTAPAGVKQLPDSTDM